MLLAERAGRKLEPWSNSRPRGMAVIAERSAVTESGLSAYFIFPSAYSCTIFFLQVQFACSCLREYALALAVFFTLIQKISCHYT